MTDQAGRWLLRGPVRLADSNPYPAEAPEGTDQKVCGTSHATPIQRLTQSGHVVLVATYTPNVLPIDNIFMVTLITYREAYFKSIDAAEAGIQQAEAADWSVSDVHEVRPGRFIVLFRCDQDCPNGVANAVRPELPAFGMQSEVRRHGLMGAMADRVRTFIHSGAGREGSGAMSRRAS